MFSFQIVDRIGRQYRRELVANSCTHRQRRRDATRQLSRVGIGDIRPSQSDIVPLLTVVWFVIVAFAFLHNSSLLPNSVTDAHQL